MSTPQLTIEALECCAARSDAALRLVCFGHAGSTGAGAFRRWARALGPSIELWAVTLPGRGARVGEPFAREWRPLVEELAEATAAQVSEPFVLFGHSLGATLAFEVTRELGRLGRSPESLMVSARGAPDQTPAFSVPASDDVFLERIEELYGGIPAILHEHPEVLDHFLPLLRADIELASAYAYEPGPPLAVPITVFAGMQDRTLSRLQVEGWRRHTVAGFQCSWLSAPHFYPPEQERELLERIARKLA